MEYFLICQNCKEFIRVGKLKLSENIICPLPMEGSLTEKEEIIEQLKIINEKFDKNTPTWVLNFLPFLTIFLKEHNNHSFCIKDEVTDHYWDPEYINYMYWKEFNSPNTGELF